jgi:hypothetical protein
MSRFLRIIKLESFSGLLVGGNGFIPPLGAKKISFLPTLIGLEEGALDEDAKLISKSRTGSSRRLRALLVTLSDLKVLCVG